MIRQEALRLYSEIAACPLMCEGIVNDLERGLIPRSYYVHEDTGKISVRIVSKNPGPSPLWEQIIYRDAAPEDRARLHLEFADNVYSGREFVPSRYHANLISWMTTVLDVPSTCEAVFSHVAITALVKCQSAIDAHARLPSTTISTCATNHLFREVGLFKPKMLIALGAEVYKFLMLPAIQGGIDCLPGRCIIRHGQTCVAVWKPTKQDGYWNCGASI